MSTITRDNAIDLLKNYNKDPFHIQHAFTIEAVMKWFAYELGYDDEAECINDCQLEPYEGGK